MIKKILLILFFALAAIYGQSGFEANKYALAQAYMQGGQYEKALPLLQGLYNSDPSNYQYFQALNEVYVQLKSYDASVVLLQDRLKTDNQNINIYGMLGTTYYLKGNEQKAFEIWDDALKNLPQSDITYRVMANFAAERRAFDKAIEYLKKGQDISKNPVFFAYDLANLYSLTMQFGNATEEYCIILNQTPNQMPVIENKILAYMSKPDALNQSLPVLEKYAQSSNLVFKKILARLYVENKNYDKAYGLYKQIDEIQGTPGIQVFNFAQYLYGENDYKRAATIFNEIINEQPNSSLLSNAKLGLAKTLEAQLNYDKQEDSPAWKQYYLPVQTDKPEASKVISAYIELTKMYPHSEIANESFIRIADIELKMLNHLDLAEQYFGEVTKNSPNSQFAPEAFLGQAKVELLMGNLSKAESYCTEVLKGPGYKTEQKNNASYRLARLSFYMGNFESAKNYLKGILDNLKDDNANDALELSLLMNTSQGDSSNLVTFASAELLAEQGKFNEAEEKYKFVTEDPQKFMLQNLAEFRLAQMELALNNYDTTITLLNKISDVNDNNIYADKALYLLGEIYQFGLKNKAKAVETYQDLLAKYPNSLYLDKARSQIIKLRDNLSQNNG